MILSEKNVKASSASFSLNSLASTSSRLEEKDGDLSQIEVDEVLGLMGDVGAEVPAHHGMPRGVILLVELLLDEGRNVLFDVVLLQRLGRAVNSILLHVLSHVGVLNHCL